MITFCCEKYYGSNFDFNGGTRKYCCIATTCACLSCATGGGGMALFYYKPASVGMGAAVYALDGISFTSAMEVLGLGCVASRKCCLPHREFNEGQPLVGNSPHGFYSPAGGEERRGDERDQKFERGGADCGMR